MGDRNDLSLVQEFPDNDRKRIAVEKNLDK